MSLVHIHETFLLLTFLFKGGKTVTDYELTSGCLNIQAEGNQMA